MISFELSEEQSIAADAFRNVARDVVRPAAAAHDRSGALSESVLQTIRDVGLIDALINDDVASKAPRSRIVSCLLLEELGWADASLAVAVGATMGFVQAVVDHGSAAQVAEIRAAFSRPAFLGAAVAVQEPGFGASLSAVKTEATPTPEGFRLSGTKCFIPGSPLCERLLVVARSATGLSAFLVDTSAPGVEVCPPRGTLGLRGMQPVEVRFRDVTLPAEARLGRETGGAHEIANAARIGTAAVLTGLSRAVFEHITPYTKERVVHGSPLAQKQSVAFRLADMLIDIPAMRWMTWRAALALEKGRCAARDARLAQIYCGERALAIADEGVQLMGGHGYMREHPVERWYRDAQTLSLLEGLVGV